MLTALMLAALSAPPAVGDAVPDVTLTTLDGDAVKLSDVQREGRKQVILVLRGWPGYQCPICSRQVADFLRLAKQFDAKGADLVFVYPGPAEDLGKRADQFIDRDKLPDNSAFVLDPDYAFTNAFDLRWDAPRETAYPSTFVIEDGKVKSATVSKGHGGRTTAKDVLKSL